VTEAGFAGFVASARRDRIRAIRDASTGGDLEALACALRRVLFTDGDAEVRAAAAGRLAVVVYPSETWLTDALGDHSALVREAILRALARRGTLTSADAVRRVIEIDRVWWVRRTAVYALAAIAGASELAAFEAALADPFWRVRHAAIKVLAVLGARDPNLRDELIAEPPEGAARSALQFLRATWGPVAVEAPERPAAASLLPEALLDPDPAVVTARLAARPPPALSLVELLADPHAPLRLLAAEHLAALADPAALTAALDWLDEPRVPNAADAVEHLLDGLGDGAIAIAEVALARTTRPGAAAWAIRWVVATRFESLYAAARAAADREPKLRALALPLASSDQLAAWAEPALIDAIAVELHDRHAYAALLALDTVTHPAARALQIDAAARLGEWARVDAGLDDLHHGPRAIATRWLVRTGRSDGRAQIADLDPAVREAALANPHHAPALIADRDPWVARAAAEQLMMLREATPAVIAATHAAHASPDPWVRARACLVPIVDEPFLDRAITALADDAEMVRSAALEALSHYDPGMVEPRLAAWAERERARATCHVHVHVDDPVAEPPRAVTERRPFGRAGFDVAPLAISGAFDLGQPALELAADAGVDLWFWEPAYEQLTKFLRERPDDHVVTGSYHADARSIEADVDRALRKLRRSHLDVLLLFWSRSPARVDPAAYAAIEHLKRSGKVRALGFSTHHRELARTAITNAPWDCVMIRHSAAHPGIETELLPTARERGTAILTFSALSYGRMVSGPNAPSPADCYRYSLSQPGVTAVISAPRRRSEVRENVGALAHPVLTAEQLAELRAHGIGVRAENQRFNTLLRQPTRDAAAAARELLAAELPPTDDTRDPAPRALPKPSTARPARTNLKKTRTRR
jgi:diketogulonate reductase-like aldo/keto reductase/HEAT repeat protein